MMMDYAVEAPAADGYRTKTKNFDAEQLIRRTFVCPQQRKRTDAAVLLHRSCCTLSKIDRAQMGLQRYWLTGKHCCPFSRTHICASGCGEP